MGNRYGTEQIYDRLLERKEREMREAQRDPGHLGSENLEYNLEAGNLSPLLVSTGPSETELVIVALLMRLYDVQMAILSHMNPDLANRVYDSHEAGEHNNPQIFIPVADSENADD